MARALRSRSSSAVAIRPAVRCAVYTRKSTDEGLDSDFNSLDAQREIAESYIASQRHDGWTALAHRYDDGGFTGANTNRPALRQLLADIEVGEIDCVVVYRYDRLSRSLLDFLQVLEFFKRHDVEFVSVSERFDTSTPHGEMALNMVLSVAQCERKIIGQRTRDKIHAARRRGMWTGGRPILGFNVVGGRLVVNKDEAAQVKTIFELYVENPSLIGVVQELNRRGWRQKRWTTKTGRNSGGGKWNKSSLSTLLGNPLSIGKQKLGDQTFKGEHERIVPKKLFDRVQGLMAGNRDTCGGVTHNGSGFLLRGLLRCSACDAAMTPTATKRRSKAYRYYVCRSAQKQGHATCPSKSISADKVEAFIVDQIRRIGTDRDLQEQTFRAAVGQVKAQRRGLRAERKRLEKDLTTNRADVERLVGAVSRTTGPAADAIASELEKAQFRVQTMETRTHEIDDELAALKAQDVDRDDLARALEEFDPIWDALLIPERERVMRLLVESIDYDGGTGTMAIGWRLAGFGQLAAEVAP